ncbi:hypothetical protein F8M41_006676 [Gigaspora margarita]|uniref:Uncharacterized protein n=1 Tax=Gigaspora margarita TaxID=4874 RepID=A0A8H4AWM6_GIGMA|nr:hypothetical protein F8M41_006676 [Gigaspora margarita]
MTTISGHIEKTLAKLKAQIEKSKIKGAYIVSSQEVTYTIEEQLQSLPITSFKRETDSQRLCQRINIFLQDFYQFQTTNQQPKISIGDTWKIK